MKDETKNNPPRTTHSATSHVARTVVTLILAIAGVTLVAQAQTTTNFYVATNGNDAWNGKSPTHTTGNIGPFASLAKAKLAVEGLAGASAVTVQVRGGTYYLPLSPTNPGTLTLGTADSGTATSPIVWKNYQSEVPVVSGGVPVGTGGLGLTWTLNPVGLWQVALPSTIQPFEYLFYNGVRILRPRIHDSAGVGYYMNGSSCISTQTGATVSTSFCNLGTFLRVANTIPPTDPLGTGCPFSTANDGTEKCLDRFKYSNPVIGDAITTWTNLNGSPVANQPCSSTNTYPPGDVSLMLVDAWTVDAMRINCVDTTNQVIYLLCPSGGGQNCGTKSGGGGNQYNFFGPLTNHRYVIENVRNALTAARTAGQTGLWFLDRSTASPILSYIANSGENPNNATVVLPQLGGQIPGAPANDYVGGSLISATNLNYVTFQNIVFEVDNFVPSYTTGFNNDVNGEMPVPQAIDCESCQHVTFDGITVRHTSASGILIASTSGNSGTAAQNDLVQNSTFTDIGDSGIRIGHKGSGSDMPGFVVNNVTVQNNLINGYSRVFPDGEGIAQANGNHILYSHNDITDGYHAGISVCQLSCPGNASGANGTSITSQYNHIWNLMQGITSDGGSLYYFIGGETSSGSDNHLLNNLIHDTSDSSIIDTLGGNKIPGTAYGGEGLYLDGQSGGVDVENNVVFHMSAHAIHLTEGPTVNNLPNPNLFENNILSLAIAGMFTQGTPWPLLNNNTVPSCDPSNPALHLGKQVQLNWNIFNFDFNEALPSGFSAVTGCTNSCTLDYDNFQDFEGNAYWRAGTPATGPLFCADPNAFHVLQNPPTGTAAAKCPASPIVPLTFDSPDGGSQTWQFGRPPSTPVPINEDRITAAGTCSYNPSFGTTGTPSDYLLDPTRQPPTPFNITLTNDTINNAGRSPRSTLASQPATFPTYSYSNSQF